MNKIFLSTVWIIIIYFDKIKRGIWGLIPIQKRISFFERSG
ncbi:hypothetical protein CLOSBL3_20537 [Clostridiaceae bacterium BL-3]|nr:hypothetical protein CLOSBL3_20537 [Clostridiaceae bacterium BL-3]